ncbi:hypothetical protein [Pyruvatibacter sp.]|uniref:hypothetical protein n=1 Tax=Pyruvatibacter sp. TaxID=1981328 RepID=UPI003263FBA2
MADQAEIVGPVIAIEGDPESSGCIDVYENVELAAIELEPWFADEPHFIVTWDGIQLRIGSPDTVRVVLTKEAGAPDRPDIARRALLRTYQGVEAKIHVETSELSNLALAEAIVARRKNWHESKKLRNRMRRFWAAFTG